MTPVATTAGLADLHAVAADNTHSANLHADTPAAAIVRNYKQLLATHF